MSAFWMFTGVVFVCLVLMFVVFAPFVVSGRCSREEEREHNRLRFPRLPR